MKTEQQEYYLSLNKRTESAHQASLFVKKWHTDAFFDYICGTYSLNSLFQWHQRPYLFFQGNRNMRGQIVKMQPAWSKVCRLTLVAGDHLVLFLMLMII